MGGVLMTHGGPSDTEGVPMAHGVHPSVTWGSQCHMGVHPNVTMGVPVAHGVPTSCVGPIEVWWHGGGPGDT